MHGFRPRIFWLFAVSFIHAETLPEILPARESDEHSDGKKPESSRVVDEYSFVGSSDDSGLPSYILDQSRLDFSQDEAINPYKKEKVFIGSQKDSALFFQEAGHDNSYIPSFSGLDSHLVPSNSKETRPKDEIQISNPPKQESYPHQQESEEWVGEENEPYIFDDDVDDVQELTKNKSEELATIPIPKEFHDDVPEYQFGTRMPETLEQTQSPGIFKPTEEQDDFQEEHTTMIGNKQGRKQVDNGRYSVSNDDSQLMQTQDPAKLHDDENQSKSNHDRDRGSKKDKDGVRLYPPSTVESSTKIPKKNPPQEPQKGKGFIYESAVPDKHVLQEKQNSPSTDHARGRERNKNEMRDEKSNQQTTQPSAEVANEKHIRREPGYLGQSFGDDDTQGGPSANSDDMEMEMEFEKESAMLQKFTEEQLHLEEHKDSQTGYEEYQSSYLKPPQYPSNDPFKHQFQQSLKRPTLPPLHPATYPMPIYQSHTYSLHANHDSSINSEEERGNEEERENKEENKKSPPTLPAHTHPPPTHSPPIYPPRRHLPPTHPPPTHPPPMHPPPAHLPPTYPPHKLPPPMNPPQPPPPNTPPANQPSTNPPTTLPPSTQPPLPPSHTHPPPMYTPSTHPIQIDPPYMYPPPPDSFPRSNEQRDNNKYTARSGKITERPLHSSETIQVPGKMSAENFHGGSKHRVHLQPFYPPQINQDEQNPKPNDFIKETKNPYHQKTIIPGVSFKGEGYKVHSNEHTEAQNEEKKEKPFAQNVYNHLPTILPIISANYPMTNPPRESQTPSSQDQNMYKPYTLENELQPEHVNEPQDQNELEKPLLDTKVLEQYLHGLSSPVPLKNGSILFKSKDSSDEEVYLFILKKPVNLTGTSQASLEQKTVDPYTHQQENQQTSMPSTHQTEEVSRKPLTYPPYLENPTEPVQVNILKQLQYEKEEQSNFQNRNVPDARIEGQSSHEKEIPKQQDKIKYMNQQRQQEKLPEGKMLSPPLEQSKHPSDHSNSLLMNRPQLTKGGQRIDYDRNFPQKQRPSQVQELTPESEHKMKIPPPLDFNQEVNPRKPKPGYLVQSYHKTERYPDSPSEEQENTTPVKMTTSNPKTTQARATTIRPEPTTKPKLNPGWMPSTNIPTIRPTRIYTVLQNPSTTIVYNIKSSQSTASVLTSPTPPMENYASEEAKSEIPSPNKYPFKLKIPKITKSNSDYQTRIILDQQTVGNKRHVHIHLPPVSHTAHNNPLKKPGTIFVHVPSGVNPNAALHDLHLHFPMGLKPDKYMALMRKDIHIHLPKKFGTKKLDKFPSQQPAPNHTYQQPQSEQPEYFSPTSTTSRTTEAGKEVTTTIVTSEELTTVVTPSARTYSTRSNKTRASTLTELSQESTSSSVKTTGQAEPEVVTTKAAIQIYSMVLFSGGVDDANKQSLMVEEVSRFGTCISDIKLPQPVYDHMTFDIHGELFVCGGFTGVATTISRECFVYSTTNKTWATVMSMPNPVRDASIAVIAEKAYMVGGWTDKPTNSVYVFDNVHGRWLTGIDMLFPRVSPCTFAWGNLLIVTGGAQYDPNNKSKILATVEVYDTSNTEGWKRLPDMQYARFQHGCTAVTLPDGRTGLAVAGGTGTSENVSRSVEFLEFANPKKWESLAPLTSARCCAPQLGRIDGNVYALSGEDVPSNSIEVFYNGRWMELPAKMFYKTQRARAVFVSSKYYESCH